MSFLQDIRVDGQAFHCNERIEDVQVKGKEGEERIFVEIKRGVFAGRYPGQLKGQPNTKARIFEERTLVFMRDNRKEGSLAVSQSSREALKPTRAPDFSHIMVPTRELLFRFSALTFNAHAIHLDKQFCREVEGHRNLLVHGPLTVVLMIEVLRAYIQTLADCGRFSIGRPVGAIKSVEYKNLAPLYAEEEMKICVRRRGREADQRRAATWDVWIEGQDGGYAVKGTVQTKFSVSLKRFIDSRSEKATAEHGITQLERGSQEEESMPEEQVASRNAINANHEIMSSEESLLEDDVTPKDETAMDTEGRRGKETEDRAEEETGEEVEEDTAPFLQR